MRYAFKKLVVWQRSKKLAVQVIIEFADCKNFALKDQITRSVLSIPSNIAEGHGRKGTKEQIQFFHISLASVSELETQLVIACETEKLTKEHYTLFSQELYEIYCMLFRLIQSKRRQEDLRT